MTNLQKRSKELVEEFLSQIEEVFSSYGYQINDEQRQRFLKTHVVDSYEMVYLLWDEWENPMKGTTPSIPIGTFVMMFGKMYYKKCECTCHAKSGRKLHIVACCDRGYVERMN